MHRRNFISLMAYTAMGLAPWRARAKIPGKDADVAFLRKADADFAVYRTLFNARIERNPAVIALCMNENGVRKAVQLARAEGLAVSIKSGGHHFDGYCSNDGGMMIDLALMSQHRPGPAGRVITAPSMRLMQVYENLMPQGRLLPTGSCAMVGLSGITLGGGYGLYSREHGLTCDWLRRARVVDGLGNVHEVAEGTDLMWALRGGGGGGLGVVTEMEFDTVACPKGIWSYRFKAYQLKPAQVADKTRAWFAAAAGLPRHAYSAYVLSGTTLTLLVTSTLPTPDATLRKALREMTAFTDKTVPGAYSPLPEGTRKYYGKLSPLPFRNASAGYYRHYQDIEPAIAEIAQLVAGNPGLLYQINTLGGAIDDPVAENHSVYAHRGYPFLGEIQSYWENPARAEPLIASVAKVQTLLRQAGVSRHYANYADGDLKEWGKSYYGESGYTKLQAIKKQLDPDNVFRHPQSIAPA